MSFNFIYECVRGIELEDWKRVLRNSVILAKKNKLVKVVVASCPN